MLVSCIVGPIVWGTGGQYILCCMLSVFDLIGGQSLRSVLFGQYFSTPIEDNIAVRVDTQIGFRRTVGLMANSGRVLRGLTRQLRDL